VGGKDRHLIESTFQCDDPYHTYGMAGMLLVKSGVAVTAITAGLGSVCYHTQLLDTPWASSLRLVRFGRAAFAVSPCTISLVTCT